MARKKTQLDKAAERAADLILAQLDTLPVEVAKKKMKDLRQMAAKAYRSSKLGTARQPRRTRATRPSTRSHARTA